MSVSDAIYLIENHENELEWFFKEYIKQYEEIKKYEEIKLIEILEKTNYLNGGVKDGLKLFQNWQNNKKVEYDELLNNENKTVFDKLKKDKKKKGNTVFAKLKFLKRNKKYNAF